jgi:hypothetical protein
MNWNITRHLALAATVAILVGCGERLSREDFDKAVKNMTAPDVQKRMGKPDAVEEIPQGPVKWTYAGRTFATGESATKLDKHATVIFTQRDPKTPATASDVTYD